MLPSHSFFKQLLKEFVKGWKRGVHYRNTQKDSNHFFINGNILARVFMFEVISAAVMAAMWGEGILTT